MMRNALRIGMVLILLGGLAHAQTSRLPGKSGVPEADAASGPVAAPAMPDVVPRVLTEAEVTRYIASLRELSALGKEAGAALDADPSAARSLATGSGYDEKMKAAIESRGFTQESFADVHGNVMMAYMATEMEGRREEMEQAMQQQQAALEAMKAQMPPEQYSQLMRSMEGMQSMLASWDEIPPGNVVLLKQHKAEIAAIVER